MATQVKKPCNYAGAHNLRIHTRIMWQLRISHHSFMLGYLQACKMLSAVCSYSWHQLHSCNKEKEIHLALSQQCHGCIWTTIFTAMTSPSQEELAAFYQPLYVSQTGKSVLLLILQDYSDSYTENCMLSDPLPALFKEELIALRKDDLLLKCEMAFISLSITLNR